MTKTTTTDKSQNDTTGNETQNQMTQATKKDE